MPEEQIGDERGPAMSPFDEVRAQLARQKWAIDSHDGTALAKLYCADCTLVIKDAGEREYGRQNGRETILGFIERGWAANSGWRPGSMIHHIGTELVEPADDGKIRCHSYALYVHLVASGATEIHGYGKYHDLWAREDGAWKLYHREVHLFGMTLPDRDGADAASGGKAAT